MFDDATVRAVERIAARLKIETAILLAIAEVESGGQVFAIVDGKKEPLIRWEGHYFDQRLTGTKRDEARRLGLANPRAGAIKNPKSQQARWDKLFRPATKIDQVAAFESTSWALGQVMGAHWRALGFAAPSEMLAMARSGAAGQIELMALYIEKFGLVDELQRKDFSAFARGYNGPAGIKAGYHTKMAAAYERLTGSAPVSRASGMLRMGSKGAKVRELQALLVRAGHPVKVDGDFGPATRDAVKAFQRSSGITVDGVAGPETMRALAPYKISPDEAPGDIPVTDVQEVRDAAKGLGPVAILMSVRDQIAETAHHFAGVDLETAQAISSGLLAVSGLIGTGLALYGLYGWWQSRQTDEGDVVRA